MPRLDYWFRLFHHASLGLASVCLLYAEAFFLPTPLLIGLYLMAGVQVLAFGADGRRWVLPAWAANLLAGAIAGGGAAWIGVELNSSDSVLADLPLPAGLLPYIGPILIGLLVVKLFRPRTPRDFWLLQGVGALQVALACVLATNPDSGLLFGLLLAGYVACALGCLALHYFQEEQQDKSSAPAAPSHRAGAGRLPFAYRMAPFCMRWTLAVVAVAAPLFLITPRLEGPTWDSLSASGSGTRLDASGVRVGFSMAIDLNRVGPVRLGGEEVFRVSVAGPPGEPVPDLPAEQRWRGGVLDSYSFGSWANSGAMRSPNVSAPKPPSNAPPLQAGWRRLTFKIMPNAGGFFVAEPLHLAPQADCRTWVEAHTQEKPLLISTRGVVLPLIFVAHQEYTYRQTIAPDDDVHADASTVDYDDDYRPSATLVRIPGLTAWTVNLLNRLVDDPGYGLSPADVQPVADPPGSPPTLPRGAWMRVGNALADYLARSGDYGYSLDLRREDAGIDPVMDFLVNVKHGHCERFASALALMLRSLGVPARIVVGFHGAGERINDYYVIRQNQAHAWVEMQKPGPLPEPPDPPPGTPKPLRIVEWTSLDPTPAADVAPAPSYTLWEWWQDGERAGQQLWGGMIVHYSATQQADLWAGLQSARAMAALSETALVLSMLAILGGLTWVGLRWRRRVRREAARTAAPTVAGYARLLELLARHGKLRPRTGHTPREFAVEARRFLSAPPGLAPFADLPDAIVDRLYLVRFGGRVLADGDNAAVAARLDQLAAALRL